MAHLLIIGECMMELSESSTGDLQRSFAGDTYNSAVYAKRCAPDCTVSFLTATGKDAFSQRMVAEWQGEGIDTRLVEETELAEIGIYAIHTDDSGERSFSYWRKGSAASQMMTLVDIDHTVKKVKDYQMVYFSGISLAIIPNEHKPRFMQLLKQLKEQGICIAFDPNYRARLWDSLEHATSWIEQCYALADVILPGLEDHQVMFNQQTIEHMLDYFSQFGQKELVIKCGSDGTFVYENGQQTAYRAFKAAPVQVDSTAAGDSFAGSYIAKRLMSDSSQNALDYAALVAAQVVQHKGAILEKDIYNQLCVVP